MALLYYCKIQWFSHVKGFTGYLNWKKK